PLPYQMPNTPSTLAPGNMPTCWLPQTAVAARSSLRPGANSMSCCLRKVFARHSAWSYMPSGEPRYPEMKPAVLSPAARSRSRCNMGSRTSACVPERNMRFASSRYLSSSPTSINAIRPLPVARSAGYLNRSNCEQNAPVLLCVPSVNSWPQDISRCLKDQPASCRNPPSLKRCDAKGDTGNDRSRLHDRDIGKRQSARGAVAEPEADASRAGLRLPRIDPRRCHRAKARLSGRHHRGPDPFQPVRAIVRADLGPGLVRDRMPVGPLPQPRL